MTAFSDLSDEAKTTSIQMLLHGPDPTQRPTVIEELIAAGFAEFTDDNAQHIHLTAEGTDAADTYYNQLINPTG